MIVRRLLLFCAAALSTTAQEPRRDPFLAPADEIRAMIPTDGLTNSNVNVQFDWIRMPHLTANQLIRQHLKHTREGDALYAAALELIAQKKAERLDLTALVARNGQRSKTESITEKPYPTAFDAPEAVPATLPGLPHRGGASTVNPSTPTDFAWRNLGRTAEVEVTIGEDQRTVDLNLAPEWVEHLADISWGIGKSVVKMPVFGTAKLTSQMLIDNGAWQLAALLTPPHGAAEGALIGGTDLPTDRVLLFVRATTGAQVKPGTVTASEPHQVTVLAEWIETDTGAAADLLAKYPAFSDSVLLREALDPLLADGRAALLESSVVQVRGGQRSKVQSITEYPHPTEFDPPVTPTHPPETKPDQPGAAASAISPSLGAFTYRDLGVALEVEATVNQGGSVIDLNLAPELVFNAGTDSYGDGVSEQKQQRFQTLKIVSQLLVLPNASALLGTFDAPLREGKSLPDVRPRKVMLFVRAIL